MSARYQVLPPTAPVPAPDDVLEAMAREGARRMLVRALEIEREEFLGRVHYQRGAEFRGYRNGYAPGRTVGTGMGAVPIRQPRVSDVPAGAKDHPDRACRTSPTTGSGRARSTDRA